MLSVSLAHAQTEPPDTTGASEPVRDAKQIFTQTVPVRPGVDYCIVCLTQLQSGDKVYLVEGQRVGVMEDMEPELRKDPGAYLARLKPRGGLFGGEMAPARNVSDSWLMLGIYITFGLGFAAICAHRAINRGQRPVPWFFAGLLFNVFGYLALRLRSSDPNAAAPPQYAGVTKVPSTSEPRACPKCGHLNHPTATACLGCHTALTPEHTSEVTRASTASN